MNYVLAVIVIKGRRWVTNSVSIVKVIKSGIY